MVENMYGERFPDRELGDRASRERQQVPQASGTVAVAATIEMMPETSGVQFQEDGGYTFPNYGGGPRLRVY